MASEFETNAGVGFDYDAPSPDPAPVIDAIRAQYRLPELTPAQKEQRRIEIEDWQEEQRWRAEDRRAERERQQAELESAARAEHAAEIAEANRLARQERAERIRRETQQRELADLRFQSAQHKAWQRNIDNAANNAIAYQQRQTLLNELEAAINLPQPPAEPVINQPDDDLGSPNIADENFNPGYWLQKPIFRG